MKKKKKRKPVEDDVRWIAKYAPIIEGSHAFIGACANHEMTKDQEDRLSEILAEQWLQAWRKIAGVVAAAKEVPDYYGNGTLFRTLVRKLALHAAAYNGAF